MKNSSKEQKEKDFDHKQNSFFNAAHGLGYKDDPTASPEANQQARNTYNTTRFWIYEWNNNDNNNAPDTQSRYSGIESLYFIFIPLGFLLLIFLLVKIGDHSGSFSDPLLGRAVSTGVMGIVLFLIYKIWFGKTSCRAARKLAIRQINNNPSSARLSKASRRRLIRFFTELRMINKENRNEVKKYSALFREYKEIRERYDRNAKGNNYTYITRELDAFLKSNWEDKV